MLKRYLWLLFLLPCVLSFAGGNSLVGKTFELRQPVFLYYSKIFNSFALEPPGFSPEVPGSVALFEQHDKSWRRYDKQQLSRHRNIIQKEFMEIIHPGTRISIVSMQRKPAVMFEVWVPVGRIDDPQFDGITFQLIGLLRDARTDKPRIDTEYLMPVADDRREFQ